jgi:hypothetical protein
MINIKTHKGEFPNGITFLDPGGAPEPDPNSNDQIDLIITEIDKIPIQNQEFELTD